MISLQWKCDVTKVGDICNKASQGKGNSPHGVKGKERPITARNNSRYSICIDPQSRSGKHQEWKSRWQNERKKRQLPESQCHIQASP